MEESKANQFNTKTPRLMRQYSPSLPASQVEPFVFKIMVRRLFWGFGFESREIICKRQGIWSTIAIGVLNLEDIFKQAEGVRELCQHGTANSIQILIIRHRISSQEPDLNWLGGSPSYQSSS
ncbi:hypothetical protein PAAG_06201 [Paracoccidioides lutzii Pb01]|uniref:Uncharacterized protein n=1 Tax=Paracoccidioides lutzii (strain ATCC MYA-826 / Pb01) TaxID=502779 RepID=C1H691_PARBA|nr:hypothetical protein PAAG_06201 [Paracoccidioides lutzii Pb01]EEH35154.2 hypothetical protein PAAG_06201 [Paracoccidioides lutzii Pb01]